MSRFRRALPARRSSRTSREAARLRTNDLRGASDRDVEEQKRCTSKRCVVGDRDTTIVHEDSPREPGRELREREPMQAERSAPSDDDASHEVVRGATRARDDDDFGCRREATHELFGSAEPRRGGSIDDEYSHRASRCACAQAGMKGFVLRKNGCDTTPIIGWRRKTTSLFDRLQVSISVSIWCSWTLVDTRGQRETW